MTSACIFTSAYEVKCNEIIEYTPPPFTGFDLDATTIAQWRFDGATSADQLLDSSSAGRHLYLISAGVTPSVLFNQSGYAMCAHADVNDKAVYLRSAASESTSAYLVASGASAYDNSGRPMTVMAIFNFENEAINQHRLFLGTTEYSGGWWLDWYLSHSTNFFGVTMFPAAGQQICKRWILTGYGGKDGWQTNGTPPWIFMTIVFNSASSAENNTCLNAWIGRLDGISGQESYLIPIMNTLTGAPYQPATTGRTIYTAPGNSGLCIGGVWSPAAGGMYGKFSHLQLYNEAKTYAWVQEQFKKAKVWANGYYISSAGKLYMNEFIEY